jgi:prepilin-type N-terminal cleavage/methylation domain-containing protein
MRQIVEESMLVEKTFKRAPNYRPSFTLVELLVAIAIIGVMAGMVMYSLAGAAQDAKVARTRGTISKINAVILERWEEYRYRSVKLPIPTDVIQRRGDDVANSKIYLPARTAASIRSVLLRDMMRMEMPDRITDLSYTPTNVSFSLSDASSQTLDSYRGRTPSREYNVLRRFFKLGTIPDPYKGSIQSVLPGNMQWTEANQSAECLYAIVAHSTSGGGSALEAFHTSEIGDTDGDKFPEFLDAWGKPISWIRWPAGFNSQLHLSYKLPADTPAAPDAFDPLHTDPQWTSAVQKPWTIVPLVVSAGPDGEFGIDAAYANASYPQIFAVHRNPYYPGTDSPAVGLISNPGQNTDNVTNHSLLWE